MDFYNLSTLFFKKRFIFIINAKEYNRLNFIKNNDNLSFDDNLSFELVSLDNLYKIINIYEISKDDPRLEIWKKRLDYPDIWKGIIVNVESIPKPILFYIKKVSGSFS